MGEKSFGDWLEDIACWMNTTEDVQGYADARHTIVQVIANAKFNEQELRKKVSVAYECVCEDKADEALRAIKDMGKILLVDIGGD